MLWLRIITSLSAAEPDRLRISSPPCTLPFGGPEPETGLQPKLSRLDEHQGTSSIHLV